MMIQIVSNRLPIKITKQKDKFSMIPSSGGLATGLKSLDNTHNIDWIGWPGIIIKDDEEREVAEKLLAEQKLNPLWIDKEDYDLFYKGFSNKVIWPLFHYFGRFAEYEKKYWEAYIKINQKFCDRVVERYEEGNIIWIHDYHLMLLPHMIRKKIPDAKIGFFLHIPFPHFEMYRELPWRKEIVEGLSGADLVGFHTRQYANYFMHAASRILNTEIAENKYTFQNRKVQVESFPMGIDAEKFFKQTKNPNVRQVADTFLEEFKDQKVVLSVDRLDYTKGIMQRLDAVYDFLSKNRHWHEKISFINLIVPSRTSVDKYQTKKQEIDEQVGRINGRFGTPFWTPVKYFFRSLDFDRLCALYNIADVGLVTPFRDGMNLVSKEYVMSQVDKPGVLILSEFAGAINQLKYALTINPNQKSQIVRALEIALEMNDDEKMERMKKMQEVIMKNNVNNWAEKFINGVKQAIKQNATVEKKTEDSTDSFVV